MIQTYNKKKMKMSSKVFMQKSEKHCNRNRNSGQILAKNENESNLMRMLLLQRKHHKPQIQKESQGRETVRLERRSNLSWKGKGVNGKELRDFRTPPGLDWNKQRKEKQKQKNERKQQRLPEVKEAPNSCPQRKVKT